MKQNLLYQIKIKMRSFANWNKWDWLVVQRKGRFYDLYSWTTLKTKSVWFWNITNPVIDQCMDIIEKNWIEYIVAWMNNNQIAIYNHEKRMIMRNWKISYSSRSYRIKRISHEKLTIFDSVSTKLPYFTIFNRLDFYDILVKTIDWWYVLEKDIKPNPSWSKTKSLLTTQERIIFKQAMMYARRIVSLSSKLEVTAEDMHELERYSGVDSYKADTIVFWLETNNRKTIEKLKSLAIWKKSYKDLINSF